MHQIRDDIWTRLLLEKPREIDGEAWLRYGGKWIVFDDRIRILDLAEKLAPYIDAGEIESAKYEILERRSQRYQCLLPRPGLGKNQGYP